MDAVRTVDQRLLRRDGPKKLKIVKVRILFGNLERKCEKRAVWSVYIVCTRVTHGQLSAAVKRCDGVHHGCPCKWSLAANAQ